MSALIPHRLSFLGAFMASLLLLPACNGNGDHAHHDHQEHSHPDDHATHEMSEEARGESRDGDMVHISSEAARRLGVTVAEARTEALSRELRAPAAVQWDETRLSTVSLRFGGWAEHLHADFTGRFVGLDTPLLDVYSPELVSAQEDLLAALELAEELSGSRVPGSVDRSDAVLEAARARLRRWQIDAADIETLETTGQVMETLTIRSPRGGYVVEKNVQAGERIEAGAPIYRLADLAVVWVEIQVFERDLRFLRVGDPVEMVVAAHPGRTFAGNVAYLYPEVDRDTRTARVRVEVPNPGLELRPGMFGTARTRITLADDAVTVPRDAVLHVGDRSIVFVSHGNDGFMIHEVVVGLEAGGRTEILQGVRPGDLVVARAGFILDAESRLMDAMMGMPGMHGDHDHDDHGVEGQSDD